MILIPTRHERATAEKRRWAHFPNEEIRGHVKEDKRDEVDEDGHVVVGLVHVEIVLHSLDACNCDARPIERYDNV